MADESYSIKILKAKYRKDVLTWNHADVQCSECPEEDPLVETEPNPYNRCYCLRIFTSLGKTVLVTGTDKNGVSQQIVAKVEKMNMDNQETTMSLTTEDLVSVGTAARNVVDLNKKNGWLYNVSIYPAMHKFAMLSVDGKVKKKSKSSIWVEINPLERVVKVDNDKVTSENANKFLEKVVGEKSKAVLQTNRGNIDGRIIGLRQTNGKWDLKFKGGQMMFPGLNFDTSKVFGIFFYPGYFFYAGDPIKIW